MIFLRFLRYYNWTSISFPLELWNQWIGVIRYTKSKISTYITLVLKYVVTYILSYIDFFQDSYVILLLILSLIKIRIKLMLILDRNGNICACKYNMYVIWYVWLISNDESFKFIVMTVYEYFNILFPILRMITRRREILIIPQRRYFTLFYVSLLITVMNGTEKVSIIY